MNIRDDKLWGPLDERTVAEFEARNHVRLPSDYRAFLLSHHGGVPDPNFYWVVPNDWGSEIQSFFGFAQGGYHLQEYLDHRESIGAASDLLVIGDDGCCSLLAIGITGPRCGHVFYIDHEFVTGDPNHERFLAPSFEAFLEQLCVAPSY